MNGRPIKTRITEVCGSWKKILLSGDALLAIAALAMVLAPLIVAVYIKLLGVNFINTDQWEFLPLVDKLYNGHLTFGDLFAQHNEHRILFPKIVMLSLAYLTHYNTVAEMYLSWLVTLASFLLIFDMYSRRSGISVRTMLMFVPAVWLFFNLRQFDNILWGWQIQIYMCIFGVIASIYMLDRMEKLDCWLAGAIICGVLATFSFVDGLLVWPTGIAMLWMTRTKDRLKFSFVYGISGVLAIIVYFYHWAYPSSSPSVIYAQSPISTAAQFFLINVGSPLAMEKGFALASGIILLMLMLALAALVVKDKAIKENAPWIALVLFSLLCSVTITFGRLKLGLWEALASRYTSLTLLSVIGIYLIATSLVNANRHEGVKESDGSVRKIAYGMVLSVVLLCIVSGYIGGIYFGQMMHDNEVSTNNVLLNYTSYSDAELASVYPHVDRIKEGILIMQKDKLNIFSG